MKIGPWTFSTDKPPVPLDTIEALHKDYDGAPDSRQKAGYHAMTSTAINASTVERLRALRDLVDELIEIEEERA